MFLLSLGVHLRVFEGQLPVPQLALVHQSCCCIIAVFAWDRPVRVGFLLTAVSGIHRKYFWHQGCHSQHSVDIETSLRSLCRLGASGCWISWLAHCSTLSACTILGIPHSSRNRHRWGRTLTWAPRSVSLSVSCPCRAVCSNFPWRYASSHQTLSLSSQLWFQLSKAIGNSLAFQSGLCPCCSWSCWRDLLLPACH